MHYCPDCLRKCWRGIFGKSALKAYDVHPEFEEEEFINPHHKEESTPKSNSKSNNTNMREFFISEKQEQQEMSVQLNLNAKSDERDIQKLIELELADEIEAPKVTQASLVELQAEAQQMRSSSSSDMDSSTFIINLDPLDPFYSYLSEQSSALIPLLSFPAQSIPTGISQCGLQIGQMESKVGVALKIQYRVNCSYSFYTNLMKNQKLQLKNFSKHISEMKIIQEYKSNLTRNSLKFKKFGMIEARDFEYLRFHNGSKGQNWELYLKPEGHQSQVYGDSKRCSLNSIIHLLEKGDTLYIKQYLQVELGTANIGNILPKIVKEMKDYYESVYEYVEENYLRGEEV